MTDDAMRAGDADRQAVVDRLSQAFVEGRLGYEEFHHRQARALEAVTFGDLKSLVADLPVGHGSRAAVAPVERLVLSAAVSTQRRTGRWRVPPIIEVTPAAADVKLDFRQAQSASDHVDVVVHGGLGSVVLIVTPRWAVDVELLRSPWGSVRNSARTSAPGASPEQRHTIVVSGSVGIGALVVRNARFWDRKG